MKAIKVLVIHNERIKADGKLDGELVQRLIKLCLFNALEYTDAGMEINAGCKNCGLCAKQQPEYFEMKVEDAESGGGAKGNAVASAPIAVFAEVVDGVIHPVSFELLGKAKQLSERLIALNAKDAGNAKAVNCPVYALLIGGGHEQAVELLRYGADKVFVYDHESLRYFLIEPYTRIFEDFIKNEQSASVLIGATVIGRSLAPRVSVPGSRRTVRCSTSRPIRTSCRYAPHLAAT